MAKTSSIDVTQVVEERIISSLVIIFSLEYQCSNLVISAKDNIKNFDVKFDFKCCNVRRW